MTAYVYTDNKGTVNLRSHPSMSGTILTQIPYQTELEVEKFDDKWSSTVYKGMVGYVMTKYLSNGKATVTKDELREIYNSLKVTLNVIENILK